jgi:kinetochore protein Spc25, fungi type
MSSAFEPSMSTSRPPIGGPSLADTLPNINFGFDELRDRMAKFTAKFDAFIEQGRKRVLEERNQFRMNVAELQGTGNPQPPSPQTQHPLTNPPQRTSA